MPPRERRAVPAALAVLAAHALLVAALLQAGVWRDRTPAAPASPPLVVRLLSLPPAAPLPVPVPAAQRPPRPRALPAAAAAAQPALEVPAAAALPQAADPTPAPPPAASVDTAPPRPLLLDLPRSASAPQRVRNPALDDPRANTPAATLESRIGAATGDGRWSVEQLPDGSRRYRRGSECRLVQPARSTQLDPFNSAVYTPPPAAGSC